MKFDPQKHHRRSIRLKGYDYTQAGAYFVTIVTHHRECLFGEIVGSDVGAVRAGLRPAPTGPAPTTPTAAMRLNPLGEIVEHTWFDLPTHYPQVELGTFCIMPNHVHAVIIFVEPVGAGLRPAPTEPAPTTRHPLSEIVRAFKSFSARRINEVRNTQGIPVWQRNYYERIIRDGEEHNRIHLYIEANPTHWTKDSENPTNSK